MVDEEFGADEGWKVTAIDDARREGADRRYFFGQVPGEINGHSAFAGITWLEQQGNDEQKMFPFFVEARAIPGETRATPFEGDESIGRFLTNLLRVRAPQPWEVQLPDESSLVKWIVEISGSNEIGQRKSFESLGVFAEAVKDALVAENLSHFLLPRSRRDAERYPWNTGQFLTVTDDPLVLRWKGYAFSSTGNLMEVETKIRVSARTEEIQRR